MYAILTIKDSVRIPPSKFNKELSVVALEELRSKYEGSLISVETPQGQVSHGIIIAVINAKADPIGVIIPGDGASYHKVVFEALVFMPFIKEVVEGEVVSATRSGLYVNLGPIDGFVHINQVADERVTFDTARGSLLLEESRRYVERGDVVRARVYATGLLPGKGIRLGMTMRQPGLGKLEWIKKQ